MKMADRRRQKQMDVRGAPEPVSVGEGLRQTIASLGIGRKLLEQRALLLLPDVMEEIAGPGGRMVRPAEIRRGELVVPVAQDALRHRLLFDRERIRARLNRALGGEVVRSIRFAR